MASFFFFYYEHLSIVVFRSYAYTTMLRTYSSVHNLWNLRQCSEGGEGPAGEGEGGVEVLPQAAHFQGSQNSEESSCLTI